MALHISFTSSTPISTTQKPSLPSIQNPFINGSKTHLQSTPNLKPLFSTHQKPITHKPNTHLTHHPIQSLFTGLVEELGEIRHLGFSSGSGEGSGDGDGGFTMKIHATTVLEDVSLGDSIAVNGACLTVTHFDTKLAEFSVGLSPETLRKTSLAQLQTGSVVNLERSVKPTTRMGGHFVQGHVDGTGEIVSLDPEGDSLWVKVKTSPELLKYIVAKGYVAVDGTSLTVVEVFDEEECFNFMLVAYTQSKVVIPLKKVGMKVNLEVDILGKYVERLLGNRFGDVNSSS